MSGSEGNNILQLEKGKVSNRTQNCLRLNLSSFYYSMLGLKLPKIEICNWFWVLHRSYFNVTYVIRLSLSYAVSWKANWEKIFTETFWQKKKYITCVYEQIITFCIYTYTHKHTYITNTLHCWLLLLHIMGHKVLT